VSGLQRMALLPLLLAASAEAGVLPRPGGELRLILPGPPGDLDPARATAPADLVLAGALHARLVDLDGAGRLQAGLAEAIPEPSEDGRSWRLRLRPGLRFHDGSPITAEAVASSLARLLRPATASPHGWIAAPVEGAEAVAEGRAEVLAGVQAIDELELRILLAHPLPELPWLLAAPAAAVVREGPGGLVGAGPFRLGRRTGDQLALLPFEGHHRGRPWVEAVEATWPEPPAAARRVARGEAHLALRAEPLPGSVERDGQLLVAAAARRPEALALLAAVREMERGDLARMVRGGRGAGGLVSTWTATPTATATSAPTASTTHLPSPRLLLLSPASLKPLADRLQVKLFDRGIRVAVELVPDRALAGRLAAGAPDLALVPVAFASPLPLAALAQLHQALGGPARARDLLRAASLAGAPALPGIAARSEAELAVAPLVEVPTRAWAHPSLRGAAASRAGAIDLAELWLQPEAERRSRDPSP